MLVILSKPMSPSLFACPHCGVAIDISQIEEHQITERLRERQSEIEAKAKVDADKRALLWAQDQIKKEKQEALERTERQSIELESLRKRDEESRKKEESFLKQENEFVMLKKNLEIEKDKARIEERKKLEQEFSKQAQDKISLEVEKAQFENDKKLRAKDEQIQQMQRSIEDAKRKGDQGSMQIQGEIQEDALKELLTTNFPIDMISDVEKGIKGADIIQEVRNEFGHSVGIIAWESKNTKAWSEAWVDKLKEDRLRVNAGVSVLVSTVLPESISRFGLHRGIWVTDYESVLPLTIAIRTHMMELAKTRNSLKGKDEKMEVLYNYLISHEFKAKIENIVEAFQAMKDDLDREKRAMEKMWSAREKQLTRVIDNTARLYGDMQGLIGSRLEKVDYLELGGGE